MNTENVSLVLRCHLYNTRITIYNIYTFGGLAPSNVDVA